MGIYALYKGEQMLSTGTIYEIANEVGGKDNKILWNQRL